MIVYTGTRTVLNVLRSIEPLIMAIVFAIWVSIGPFAGVLALTLHSVAALAKLYRFAADPREGREEERLRAGDGDEGWAGCKFHLNCTVVCPMNVPQNMAIGKARQKLMSYGKP